MSDSLPLLLLCLSVVLSFFSVEAGAHLRYPNDNGRVSALVFDVNDARVAGAKVTIEARNYKRTLSTSPEGNFQVDLPAGEYDFTVDANGFCKFQGSLKIKSGATEILNIHLEVAVYDSQDACKCTSRPTRNRATPPNNSLDRSGGSVFRIKRGAARIE